jgi:hypothetical protein
MQHGIGVFAFYEIHHPTKVNGCDPQGKWLISLTSNVVVNSIPASYET